MTRDELQTYIHRDRDLVMDTVHRTKIGGCSDPRERDDIIAAMLKDLDQLLREAKDAPEREFDRLYDASSAASRRRVYLFDDREAQLEAYDAWREMSTWGVPADVLQTAEYYVKETAKADVRSSRAALYRLLDEYDFWDYYIDWFLSSMTVASVMLAAATLVLLSAAFWLTVNNYSVIACFVLSGLAGACVSVLARLPRLTTYGRAANAWLRIPRRLAVGMLTSAVGLGLLTVGIVPLSISDSEGHAMQLSQIAQSCITSHSSGHCDQSSRLLLISIALLLGFSERLLPRFEDVIAGAGAAREAPRSQRRAPTPKRLAREPLEDPERDDEGAGV
jgi:hypothetical protein